MRYLVIIFVLLFACQLSAATIYRCEGDRGEVLFSQTPCGAGSVVGYTPESKSASGGLRDTEKAWLKQRSQVSEKRPKSKSVTPANKQIDKSQKKKCWDKQKKLDEVKRRLRSGYKASQSSTLRGQREDYEEYLRLFCR